MSLYIGASIHRKPAVKRCKTGQLRKTLPANNHQFHIISIDNLAIDPRHHSRNKVLTVVVEYAKFAIFMHKTDEAVKSAAQKLIDKGFLGYGLLSSIHSDNGRVFVN